ncbi:putative Bet v I/Major latex protein [Helianthus annuus]|nr:putative Bet v I/Major latex protein [Helianthus annuus]
MFTEMVLSGKLIGNVEISKSGDVFHDILRHKSHEVVAASPDKVHDRELHEGERGVTGSVTSLMGKKKFSKHIIESVNEEQGKPYDCVQGNWMGSCG